MQKEFAKGLLDADSILNNWKNKKTDNRDSYHQLFKMIIDFDKHIGRRYDRMTGSTYLFIIAGQLIDGVISEKDLEKFSEEIKQKIKSIADL